GVERERLAQVHLEDERATRDLRPHLDPFGTGRDVRFHDLLVPREALTVSSAVQVSGRPIARWISNTSAWVIFSPGSSAATPLPASRSGSSNAVSSGIPARRDGTGRPRS